jgi:O-antigen/teichoic acid export membrane protein
MRIPAVARRAGWNLADQAISSLTNAALSILVARSVEDTAFGGFAVAFTVFTLLIGVSRALATSPMGIRFSAAAPGDFGGAAAAATGTALAFAAVAGLGCVVAGLVVAGPAGPALLALGVIFPGLIVQDAWRQVFFAAGRPDAATLNDAVWAVVQLGAVWALLVTGSGTVAPLVLAWGGAAVAASLLGVRQAGTWPRPDRTARWLRAHRDLTGYMGLEFATLQGTQQAALLLIAAIGSLEAIGALRGVQVLLGPATVIATAALSFAIPEFARRRATLSARQWMRAAVAVAAAVSVLGFGWGLLFVLAPDPVGRALLGDTWDGAREILWITIVGQVGSAVAVGPAAMLYAMDRAKVTLGVHAVFAPLMFVGGVGGVLLADAPGAAWGFTIAFCAVVPLWWVRLRREAIRITTRGAAA